MYKHIVKWELFGIVIICLFGTSLHFLFEWTGYFRPIAIIAAVNESTWEHFKMAYWPGLIYGFIEYLKWGNKENNFFLAKAIALFIMATHTSASLTTC